MLCACIRERESSQSEQSNFRDCDINTDVHYSDISLSPVTRLMEFAKVSLREGGKGRQTSLCEPGAKDLPVSISILLDDEVESW